MNLIVSDTANGLFTARWIPWKASCSGLLIGTFVSQRSGDARGQPHASKQLVALELTVMQNITKTKAQHKTEKKKHGYVSWKLYLYIST